jgi:SAM-dependent methyltransferase
MGMSAPRREASGRALAQERTSAVMWHDLECGSYTADMSLWRELACPPGAEPAAQAVLDVGAGTGRVALELARRGHPVTALDLDPELLATLRERADRDQPAGAARVVSVCADARTFELDRRDFALCLLPMQTVQLLGGALGRAAFLRRARAHLRPGGLLACAIVTELDAFDCADGDLGPSPEIARLDGVEYISRATRVHVGASGIRIERERELVSVAQTGPPARTLAHDSVELDVLSASRLQGEGRAAGFSALATRSIPATEEHVGGQAVLLRV